MPGNSNRDRGQAFPIYMWMVASLLFVALAFFAVGQAGAARNNAQGAADAAALAGAQKIRDTVPWSNLGDLKWEDWEDILDGRGLRAEGACTAASAFAAENQAVVQECDALPVEVWVRVQNAKGLGRSVVPGVSSTKATAQAAAEVKPRCHLGPKPDDPPDPGDDDPADGVLPPFEIRCTGKTIHFDPLNPGVWKDLSRTLFTVQLVD
ncbi:pilus assembly protein TadG-related protein [Streptomyces bambusae]|uniref:pilus assembly protein TadG-related protein n=1 Tax=Streptomyces bambusae TaxID=1550616 RepID=UPI001D000677|nr:pilus assembly protein TadG-related protein [Streptomyces bambusae]MCB5170075.1 pilus assembly protein TadG-related protein [Streptomyces bambusae]